MYSICFEILGFNLFTCFFVFFFGCVVLIECGLSGNLMGNLCGSRGFSTNNDDSFSWIGELPIDGIRDKMNEFEKKKQILVSLAKQGDKDTIIDWIDEFGIRNKTHQKSIAAVMIDRYQQTTATVEGLFLGVILNSKAFFVYRVRILSEIS